MNEPSPLLPVILIGAGGHAKVLIDLLRCAGRTILFVTDRNPLRHGMKIASVLVRGDDALIYDYAPDQVGLVNAVGSIGLPKSRREVYERFATRGYRFETLVHPAAVVARSVRLAAGAQVMAGAIVQTDCVIGENVLVNTKASIDHDCVIGSHCHIAPGVTLSGQVHVGSCTHIGAAATVIQGIQVGKNAIIGAGAVVIRDVRDGEKVVGVPAKPMAVKGREKLNEDDQAELSGQPRIATPGGSEDKLFTVMVSAAGRRVALLRLLRQSVAELGMEPRVLATDITRTGAAFQFGDVSRLVPRYGDPQCLDALLELCREFRVRLIVPTIDPDLPFYAKHRQRFEEIGTYVMVSSAETIAICNDKKATHEWLVSKGFPTLRQIDTTDLMKGQADWTYPVFIKPRGGSSSMGARVVQDVDELRLYTRDGDYIAQEVAKGREYTVDVFIDRQGHCRCAVPRLRIETRGGEVTKAMTARLGRIEELAMRIAEALPGACGVMNIQMFYDEATGALKMSEINPRFGGGYPLAHQAGAPMARWVMEELAGLPLSANNDQWTNGMVMLRYDEAVFVDAAAVDLPRPAGGPVGQQTQSTTR